MGNLRRCPMEAYPVDPAEPLSTERDADPLPRGGLWSALTGNGKVAAPSDREQYAQLGAARLGGGMQWAYGPRRPGKWANAAAGWALVAALALAWHYAMRPIGLDRPLTLAALLAPIPLALGMHCLEACFGKRWLVLTEETLRFPAHRFTSATVELPTRELVSVRHEPPAAHLAPLALCCGCGHLVLADASGAEHRVPGDCLPSQQDIMAVVHHVEDAMQGAAAPGQITAVCCE